MSVQEIREVRGATAFVEPGFEPTLPDYVYVVSSTGLEQAIPVTWDAIDPSDYEHENVFEVMGTVQGTSQRAVATVYVSEVTSVSEQTMVVAVGGSITWLSGVTVTNALGNTNWVDSAWDLPEEGDERLQQAGTFDIYGAIPGSDNQAVCHVMVIDPAESSYEESVKLTVGESYLPGDISIELPDGSSSHIAVDWIWPDMDLFNRAGSFDVEGVISGTDIPVTLHVTMVDIQSIDALDSIGTVEGVVPELPYFVDVTYTDGSRGEEEVEWSVPDPSEILSDASPITITGQTRFGTNREVEVQVEVLWAQPAREPVEVSTLVGVAPALPYTVPMTMSDGSRQQLVVQWEQPTPDQYATAGTTFEAKGYVAGSDYPVTAEVAVCAAAKDGTATEVSTIVGVAPNLSSDINVTLDNGDVFYIFGRVAWDEVDPASYAQAGDFEVSGRILGTEVPVTARVHVGEAASEDVFDIEREYFIDLESAGTMQPESVLGTSIYVPIEGGGYADLPVTWNDLTRGFLTTPGTYTFTGVAGGHDVTMTVVSMRVLSVEATEPVTMLAGAAIDTFDGSATATVDDGSGQESAREVWYSLYEGDPVTFEEAGTYTEEVTCWISGSQGSIEMPVSITFEVLDAIQEQEEVSEWTLPGVEPVLPETIMITPGDQGPLAMFASFAMSLIGARDASEPIEVRVTWEDIDPALYAPDKVNTTFDVAGVIEGTDTPVKATVEVADIESVYVPSVSTAPGVVPEIPGQVVVTTTMGT